MRKPEFSLQECKTSKNYLNFHKFGCKTWNFCNAIIPFFQILATLTADLWYCINSRLSHPDSGLRGIKVNGWKTAVVSSWWENRVSNAQILSPLLQWLCLQPLFMVATTLWRNTFAFFYFFFNRCLVTNLMAHYHRLLDKNKTD